MTMTPLETVEAVARLRETWLPVRSDFHLAPCGGCGGPSFGRPCALCGYHPGTDDPGRWYPPRASAEYFAAAVDRSGIHRTGGNLATWHARSLQRALRPGRGRGPPHPGDAVEALLARAQDMRGLAPARAVYDVVARSGTRLGRTADPAYAPHWEALAHCMALVSGPGSPTVPPVPDHRHPLVGHMRAVVSAIHGDDPAAARAAAELCRTELAALVREGRLRKGTDPDTAARALETVIDGCGHGPAP